MKRLLLSILFAAAAVTLAITPTRAQTQAPDTTRSQPGAKRPATERAVRQLKAMEKRLRLSQDQVLQLQVILIHKDIAMDSIRNNTSGNRKADNQARRSILQDADAKIYAMLSEPQRTLYQHWKQDQRQKALLRKQSGTPQDDPQ